MKLKYLFLLTALLIFSCQNSTEEVSSLVSNIEIEGYKQLVGKEVKAFGEGCFRQIEVIDSVVVLLDPCSEKQFQLYSLSGSPINSFGRDGDGPNEFKLPSIKYEEGDGIWVHDINKNRFKYFDRENILTGEGYPTEEVLIPPGLLDDSNLIKFADSVFLGANNTEGKGNFFFFNTQTEVKDWSPFHPKVTNEPIEKKRPTLYEGKLVFEPQKRLLVKAYQFFNQLSIYNMEGELQKDIIFGDALDPDFSQPSKWFVPDEAVYAFLDVKVTGEAIYGLYSGLHQNEYVTEEGYPKSGLNKSYLYIVNWDGELLKAYELDKYLRSFDLDMNNFIYGLAEDDSLGVKKVYKFDLK